MNEELLAKLVSSVEDDKFGELLRALLGIKSLSEAQLLDRLGEVWEHGYKSAEKIVNHVAASKIKMTKELPTKSGWYYWKSCDYDDLVFVLYFDGNHSVFRSEMCRSDLVMIAANPEDMGGYWAKVDKDQFEFTD